MTKVAHVLAVLCVAAAASLGFAERASAAGFSLGAGAMAPAGAADAHLVHGWCGKKYGCPVEPPYAFYPPPRVPLRCFGTRFGDLHCPYASYGKLDTGACVEDHWGRRVCGPNFYRARPAYKAKPVKPPRYRYKSGPLHGYYFK